MALQPHFPLFLTASSALLLASCAATYQDDEPVYERGSVFEDDDPRRIVHERNDERSSKFEFQFVYSDEELDEIELDLDDTTATLDIFDLDRKRVELRLGGGPERARGRFFFFGESFGDDVSTQLQSSDELDVVGIGGGMTGAPLLGSGEYDAEKPYLVLPYEWDISVAYGDEDDSFSVGYAEVRASVGLGVEWFGLRPHAGVDISAIAGGINHDTSSALDDASFSGFNAGLYGEVRFNPPGTPLLMRLRGVTGDIESFEFGFGVQI